MLAVTVGIVTAAVARGVLGAPLSLSFGGSGLARLLDAIAPDAPDLPGAGASDVVRVVAARLVRAPSPLRARIDALLAASARAAPLDDTALDALAAAHGEALRWVAAQTFAVLYGTARHDGVGERRAFRTLAFP